jgi:flagellar hook-associated protein 1 FlgK
VSDFGLSIAASGLSADSAELDTASNNLSNINTPGYAQEVVDLSPEAAAGPLGAGRGVIVSSVSELTDAVYASANVAAEGVQGAASAANQVMTSIQTVFPEPSTDGLAAQLSTFWGDLSTLAANPNQAGAQETVAADADGLAESLNSSSTQLSELAASLQSGVGTGSGDGGTLAQANSLLGQVAQLNQGIVAGDSGGQNVNTLTDERRAAVDQLAGLLGISTSTAPNGALTVNSGGVQLVSGDVAQTLVSTGSAATTNLGVATSSGIALHIGGSIGASLTAVNSTLPGYQAQLSAVADSLAGSVNALQANGMAANGDPGAAIAGGYTGCSPTSSWIRARPPRIRPAPCRPPPSPSHPPIWPTRR